VASIVRSVHPDADDDVCAACLEASVGNPFLLRELLRSVAADESGAPPVVAIRAAAVGSVGDRVMRRVVALGPHATRLAAAMSVLGSSHRLRDAATVAGSSEAEAAEAALSMRRVELLVTEDPFEWIHPLVRRSVYDRLTVVERDELHARAAEVLAAAGAPPGVVAAQLAELRPAGSTEVVAVLLAAADDALARNAPEVAVSLLDRALEEGASEPDRATLLLRLGQVQVTRRDPAAFALLSTAREQSTDARERTLAAVGLGEILTYDGHWDECARIVGEAIAELDGADEALALELEVVRAAVYAFDPQLAAELWRERERLRGLAAGPSWPARALAAMLAMTGAMRGEHLEEIAALCEHAHAGGVLFGERGAGAWAASHLLNALAMTDRLDEVLARAAELEEAARAQGALANVVIADGYRGLVAARRGDLVEAEEILRPMAEMGLASDMLLVGVTALWWLDDVTRERADLGETSRLVEGLEPPASFLEAAGGAWFFSVRGELRALRGVRAEAEADLRAAGEIYHRLGFGPLHRPWRSTLALVLAAEQAEEALALVEEELAIAERTGMARPRGVALRALGLVRGGEAGITALRASAAAFEGGPARYERARSLVELGEAMRRAGQRAEAREPLAAGMELAFACGAERLVARAREELSATGARPRRVVRSGFAALTVSERRIARLAAAGHTNPEIAQ
jgi:hypothetical protein